jgi:hypothetical protein
VQYLVRTPKGRLSRLEKALLDRPWAEARPGVQVKLLPQDGELYVFAQSADRVAKERDRKVHCGADDRSARADHRRPGTRFVIAPSSQELEPPGNPARFTLLACCRWMIPSTRIHDLACIA